MGESSSTQRVRVVSDGTQMGTKVYAPDGTLIDGVVQVTVILDVHQRPTVELVLYGDIDLDLTADAVPPQ